MALILETPRLLLRQFRDSDLEFFLAYRNDPQVTKFQGWQTPFTHEDGLNFINKMKTIEPGTPGEWMQLAIECRDMNNPEAISLTYGNLIGDVAFHVTKSNLKMAYSGYSLSRTAWGKGYASESVRKMLDYLFRVLDLHRVVAECDVENTASIRLLERTGFRREAHYVENFWLSKSESWGSEYLYALLQREWMVR